MWRFLLVEGEGGEKGGEGKGEGEKKGEEKEKKRVEKKRRIDRKMTEKICREISRFCEIWQKAGAIAPRFACGARKNICRKLLKRSICYCVFEGQNRRIASKLACGTTMSHSAATL